MNELERLILKHQTTDERTPNLAPLIDVLQHRYGPNIEAVFLYGSCRLSPIPDDGLIDLCVIVPDLRQAHRNSVSKIANSILPPNVYFIEAGTLRSKYILVSRDDFEKKMHSYLDPYFWARFSQPITLIHQADESTAHWLAQTQIVALQNFYRQIAGLAPHQSDFEAFWSFALQHTYRCELRPEPAHHAAALIAKAPEYWAGVFGHLTESKSGSIAPNTKARWGWHIRPIAGKLLNLMRLMKAASTVSQGIDYIAWKVQRHSGVEVKISAWMRRYPRLASIALAWQLWRAGGFR